MTICTENGVTPCGACRQLLNEFVDPNGDAPVWIIDGQGSGREATLFTLMPDPFGPRHLGG